MGCISSKKKKKSQLQNQISLDFNQKNQEGPPKIENTNNLIFQTQSLKKKSLEISQANEFQQTCFLKNGLIFDDLDIKNHSFISRGVFGDVIKIGLKSNDSLKLAVKIMNIDDSDKDSLDDIKREIEIHELLSKQMIKPQALPKYYGYVRKSKIGSKTDFYLCFECLPYTLDFFINEHIKNKTLISNQLLIQQFNMLVNALSYLQILGICHRDLKPKNILLDDTKKILTLIDFGISKIFVFDTEETKINVDLAGNKMYMSPELMDAFQRNVNALNINPFKSDAFSFGLVFYQLWTLRKLSDKMNQDSIDKELKSLQVNIEKEPNSLMRFRLQKMLGILQKCLRINASERWDFLKIYKENFYCDQKKKIKLHMMVDIIEKPEFLEEFFKKSNLILIFF